MAAPNHRHVTERVWARGGWGLSDADICRFTEACAVELHAEDQRWGHLRKNPGQTQCNGHALNAVLYLSDTPGQSTAVDIIRVGDLTITGPRWLEDIPRYSPQDWIRPIGAPPPPTDTTRLGASLFWLLRGYRDYRAQLDANLRWIKQDLGADFVRAILVLGGDLFRAPDGSLQDPWRDASVPTTTPGLIALVSAATGYTFNTHGLKVYWTLVGGRAQVSSPTLQDLAVDGFAQAISGLTHAVELVEIWNEYLVNNGTPFELRQMARRLRTHLGASVPIALSSPDCIMGGHAPASEVHAEVHALYGVDDLTGNDSGASAFTIHPTRPEPIWGPGSDYGPHAPKVLYVGEPRGPGASAGGDVNDPQVIAGDYRAAITAKARGYVFHTKAGIWGGHCHPAWPEQNAVANVYEHPTAAAIAGALKALRNGDHMPPPPPPTGRPTIPPREEAMNFGKWLDVYYASPEGLQRPNGLSINGRPDWEGVGAWMFDIWLHMRVDGKTEDEARAAVVAAIQQTHEYKERHS